jgi:hypothetical protein
MKVIFEQAVEPLDTREYEWLVRARCSGDRKK